MQNLTVLPDRRKLVELALEALFAEDLDQESDSFWSEIDTEQLLFRATTKDPKELTDRVAAMLVLTDAILHEGCFHPTHPRMLQQGIKMPGSYRALDLKP